MPRVRRLISLLLTFNLLMIGLPLVPTLAGESIRHQQEAQVLNSLGLFQGSEQGFELNKIPTRAQGAVMLVRLLGKESQAKSSRYQQPFSDLPSWASPYVAYMYHYGLTQGSSAHSFRPDDPLSAAAYTTFVLRALGYNDNQGDFTWNHSLEKARDLGLMNEADVQQLLNQDKFKRDDMVWISYLSLNSKLKNRDFSLIQKLVEEDKAVGQMAAQLSGLYSPASKPLASKQNPSTATAPTGSNKILITNQSQMQMALQQALLDLRPEIRLQFENYPGDPLGDFGKTIDRAQDSIASSTGLCNLLGSWGYKGNSDALTVKLTYRYTKSQLLELDTKADEIVKAIIQSNMAEYYKEKTLHDYIIEHSRYDYENLKNKRVPPLSYTAYGVLVSGQGVCQGYAEAMNILSHKAGLECMMITGRSSGSGNWEDHAWNLIKLDGSYYHLDTTWDDPVADDGKDCLTYNYFNLNDEAIIADHQWDQSAYPTAKSTKYNYYIYNNQYVSNYTEFKNYVTAAINKNETAIELRILAFASGDYADLGDLVFNSNRVKKFHYTINNEQGIVSLYDLEYR